MPSTEQEQETAPPPATASIPAPASVGAANDDTVTAYLVVSRTCVDKPVEQWRSCGQGRWLTPNVPALFASLSPASAFLEALVNQDLADPSSDLVLVGLRLPRDRMLRMEAPPEHWRERPWRADVRSCGDRWAQDRQSLALRVPSALCPGEFNVLLNPQHPDFALLERGEPEPLAVEPRLRRV